jgi:F-type H+-transporting ATPase subunit b
MRRDINWSKLGIAALVLVAMTGCAALAYAVTDPHAAAEGFLGIQGHKWTDLGWRAMNFAALVIILVWFLKKPIVNGLRGRRQHISDEFDELESKRSEAERMYQEYASRLAGLDEELKKMVETAVAQGEVENERIIAEANDAAAQITRQAEMAEANAVAESKLKLRREVADLAAVMAEDIIKNNLNADDQVALVEGYLAKVGGAA